MTVSQQIVGWVGGKRSQIRGNLEIGIEGHVQPGCGVDEDL